MMQKILVVEDDSPILDLMEILIRRLGYEPVLITNGFEALDSVRAHQPALILLDIMMMPMSGWEFLEKLRSEYKPTMLLVIIFTAAPSAEKKIAIMKDPLLGMLTKPVSMAELRAGIKKFVY